MKQFAPRLLHAFLSLAAFSISFLSTVLSVGLQPFMLFKTFVVICSHMLADLLVMMYSASVSGAICVGNKLFGSVAATAYAPDYRQRC